MTSSYSEADLYYKLDNIILASCQHLRKVFKNRWKHQTGNDWLDDAVCKDKLLTILIPPKSKTKRCPLQSFQQKFLKEKPLGEWDMSLLSAILLLQNTTDQKKIAKENEAIRNLKNIRNELAHDSTGKRPCNDKEDQDSSRKCTPEEYEKHAQTVRDSLHCLGMEYEDITKLIERSGVTSSLKAFERVNHLYEKAKLLITQDKIEDAIIILSYAVSTPSLLPEHRGEAYEKRAECYLQSAKYQLDDNRTEKALLDIKQALEHNSSSWNAHYLAAQCYRQKNNLSEAITHYETALSISPLQKHVKHDLYACRILAGVHIREDHMNPDLMPINLEERLAYYINEMGDSITTEEFIFLHGEGRGRIYKGQDFVFLGHQYFAGWKVGQDFSEAVKYYAKADKVGNAEGSYNLGLCYENGRGVKQDIGKAVKIYRRIANMDENTLGITTVANFNIGVAASKHALGLCHEYGTGVEKDFNEAVYWYRRAMECGVGPAANNLGLMYLQGMGVAMDEKMAVMCWRRGVELKDVNAVTALAAYYVKQLEPELAREMFKLGREMGNRLLLHVSDEEINRMLEEVTERRDRLSLVKADSEIGRDSKGLLFGERCTRSLEENEGKFAEIMKFLETDIKSVNMWAPGIKIPLWSTTLDELKERAEQNSEQAMQIVETIEISIRLSKTIEKNTEISDELKKEVVEMMYKCATLVFKFTFLKSQEVKQRVNSIINSCFEETCEKIGVEDMKARLCHLRTNLFTSLHLGDDIFALATLKEGVSRYPNNVLYHNLLISVLVHREEFKEGLSCADKALNIFPDNADLLFGRAVHLHGCQETKDFTEVRVAYTKFIDVAPNEHTKLSEAYYLISWTYVQNFPRQMNKDTISLIETFFKLGEQAEKDRLPGFEPYESDQKVLVSSFLRMFSRTPDEFLYSPSEDKDTSSFQQPKGILERKEYLKSPVRKFVFLQHRNKLKNSKKICATTTPPKLEQKVGKKLLAMKPITLVEMNPAKDEIFENRIIELTLLDDPVLNWPSIHLIAEDENGDITFLYVYNVDKDKKTTANFQVGCRIAVINPYMRISSSLTNGIRVDEPRCIVYLEKLEDICRFCGEEKATRRCSKCKRLYCSKECQTVDWKELGHKLICFG